MSQAARFTQALAHLMPQGFAWPRDPDSVLMAVLRGNAALLAEHHDYTTATVAGWQPTTTTRLAEWEEAAGLPDDCFAGDEATRRQLLLMRLRRTELPFEDSSPAAPAVIEAICAQVGYAVSAAYNTPFRAGMRTARRLGALDGCLYLVVALPEGRFRAGACVGQRLIFGAKTSSDLACLLNRLLPARYQPIYVLK